MIFGSCEIDRQNGLMHTHSATFRLGVVNVGEAPRRYLATSVVISGLLSLFGIGFWDIIWPNERLLIGAGIGLCLMFGWHFTFLSFGSRDLGDSGSACALYGTHRHLNRIRREVLTAGLAWSGGRS